MKIAFVGDSFCADPFFDIRQDEYRPYQYLVAETFNAEIILAGTHGQCFYHSFHG